jgi:uncharacterized protein YbbC (DUF1343 family)
MMKYFCFILLLFYRTPVVAQTKQPTIVTGAERMNIYLPLLKNKRVAMLVNQTSEVNGVNLVDTLLKRGVDIREIFSPEHGFRGKADAGATVGNSIDSATGLPVISLYGAHTRPTAADLKNIDILVYDVQDVGVRFYTYISSMQRLMEAAAAFHKPLIILDRPDPNGFYVDGPVLDTAYHSFVGLQPIPVVYGMTIGEYAEMLNGEHWLSNHLHCRLTVIKCLYYTHESLYSLPVKPSPNLPNMASVYLYPSLCLFEGTTLSVGRGTNKAFQQFGAPSMPHYLYHFEPVSMPGATHPPHENETCYGFDLSGTNADVLTQIDHHFQLKWILKAYQLFPDKSDFFNNYFDKLAGNGLLENQIKSGMSEAAIRKSWQPALNHFKVIRKKYLLYP